MSKQTVPASEQVRVAFIGAGAMAQKVHYPSLAEMDDVRIAAVCDLSEERRDVVAQQYGVERTFADYRRMLDETECDAVYCIMPPHQLFDVAVSVLSQGCNLFIEKPPGITSFQARALAERARGGGCLSMVGFNRRFAPLHTLARELIAARGPVDHVAVSFLKYSEDPYYYGGAIDILHCDAIHAVDTLRWFGGDVLDLASTVRSVNATFANATNALVTFVNGATGQLTTHWQTGRRFLGGELHAPGISLWFETEKELRAFEDNDLEGTRYLAEEVAGSAEFHHVGGYFHENRHFIDSVKAGTEPGPNLSEAARTMELADAILGAALEQ